MAGVGRVEHISFHITEATCMHNCEAHQIGAGIFRDNSLFFLFLPILFI